MKMLNVALQRVASNFFVKLRCRNYEEFFHCETFSKGMTEFKEVIVVV